ncbi:division plane positioning ATPase MipZ [Devosia sp. A449]
MPSPQETRPIRLPASFKRFILLVAASKGGAGKSTITIHLAVAAHLAGIRTIILDTDIEDEQQSCAWWAEVRTKAEPMVKKVAPSHIVRALAWAERQGFECIIVDTPGRDMVAIKTVLDRADFMLTPSQPSPLDLKATKPIRRLWGVSQTPGAIVLNGVVRATQPRTQIYLDRYAALGQVLPAVVGRRVQYIDAIEQGLGVSEHKPGEIGDREICRLLAAIFAEAERRRGDNG